MDVTLRTNARRYVEEKVRSGAYSSPEAVIEAGLAALRQQESFGSFDSGELDSLIAEGERSIKNEGVVPAAEVFKEFVVFSVRARRGRHFRSKARPQ